MAGMSRFSAFLIFKDIFNGLRGARSLCISPKAR